MVEACGKEPAIEDATCVYLACAKECHAVEEPYGQRRMGCLVPYEGVLRGWRTVPTETYGSLGAV